MRHQAQYFDQFSMLNDYEKTEHEFIKNAQCISRSSVPPDGSFIGNHFRYKVKVDDNESIKLKARIAPHGN